MRFTKVAMISGGKDSTAMAIKMIENDMEVDEWIFCDTGKEFPQMYEHLERLQSYLGIKLTILKSEKSFDYYFSEHIKTKGTNIGKKGYGWPSMGIRWCTYYLKQRVTELYLSKYDKVIEYHGIALDESERALKNKNKIVHYPLLFLGMTEKNCLDLCYKHGFNWGGLYDNLTRVSCYCCPIARIDDLRTIFLKYPDIWEKIRTMDYNTNFPFKNGKSFKYWEDRFKRQLKNTGKQITFI